MLFRDFIEGHWCVPALIIGAISAIYGAALIYEHCNSSAIVNHSLINFTPQLTVGLISLTLGILAFAAGFVRAITVDY
jgi:hypothetical protein